MVNLFFLRVDDDPTHISPYPATILTYIGALVKQLRHVSLQYLVNLLQNTRGHLPNQIRRQKYYRLWNIPVTTAVRNIQCRNLTNHRTIVVLVPIKLQKGEGS